MVTLRLDIKNERIKDEVLALYKSINEFTEQKAIMDAKFKQYNKGNKKGYSPDDIVYFCNYHKIKCFGYDWKMQQFITNKNDLSNFNKIYLHLYFILMIVIYT